MMDIVFNNEVLNNFQTFHSSTYGFTITYDITTSVTPRFPLLKLPSVLNCGYR